MKTAEEKVELVPISGIKIAGRNVRTTFDDEKLTELANSIRERGVLHPVVCRRVNGRLELIAGERRVRAATLVGLREIPAIIREADDEEVKFDQIIENLQREDLSDDDQFRALKALQERGLTIGRISKMTGLSTTSIQRILVLDTLKPSIRKRSDVSSYAKAFIARAPDHVQDILAERVATGAVGSKQLGHDVMPAISEALEQKSLSTDQKREVVHKIVREANAEREARAIVRDVVPAITQTIRDEVFSEEEKELVVHKILREATPERPARTIVYQERGKKQFERGGIDVEIEANQVLKELVDLSQKYQDSLITLQATRFEHLDPSLVTGLVMLFRTIHTILGEILQGIEAAKKRR